MDKMIISCKEARAQGLKRFFTGEPCKNGHVAEKYVSSGMCSVCCVQILRERYQNNPDHERSRSKAWRNLNLGRALARDAKYRQENPEKRRAAEKRWKDANPGKVKENIARGWRKYHEKNPAAAAKSKRKWLAVPENKVARTASIKAWRKANPEKSRAITRNRRARIAGASGTHTVTDLIEIMNAQGHQCAYCRTNLRRTKKHVDHIHPLSLGGSNGRENLQYLCAPCNQTKNARDPVVYARSIGLLI